MLLVVYLPKFDTVADDIATLATTSAKAISSLSGYTGYTGNNISQFIYYKWPYHLPQWQ